MTDPSINQLDNKANAVINHLKIARRGQAFYRSIREQVENRENMGKIIAIDITTGSYEIDDNLLEASDRLQQECPDATIWLERIGFSAVYATGGSLTKVDLS
jgi:hypothetical protein